MIKEYDKKGPRHQSQVKVSPQENLCVYGQGN